MKDPFALLDIDETADDETVRRAYLQQVRAYPPDHNPERFQEIRQAYEAIGTYRERMALRLFVAPEPDLLAMITPFIQTGQPALLNKQAVLALLSESVRAFRLPASVEQEKS